MKVGIVTFFYANNPGSVLQSYALQRVINNIDKSFDCSFCDFRIQNNFSLIGYLYSYFKGYKFKKFREEFLKVSCRYYYQQEGVFNYVDKSYDKFIVGSDQVWNPQITGIRSPLFFLSFVNNNKKKNTYAASIGIDGFSEEEAQVYGPLMKSFNHISVREKSSISLVKALTGREAEYVLDPTLLLHSEEWLDLSRKPKENNYVFVYGIKENNTDLLILANHVSKDANLPVIQMTGGVKNHLSKSKKILFYGPQEWLGYINNAQYVVTDSFHGIVFCLLFKKPFFVRINPSSTCKSRIYNILEEFGLSDRIISDIDNFNVSQMPSPYFGQFDSKIGKLRDKSISYLRTILYEK